MRRKEIEARLDRMERDIRYFFYQQGSMFQTLEEASPADLFRLILNHLGLRPEIKRSIPKEVVLVKKEEEGDGKR
jgi:hypothetical protein